MKNIKMNIVLAKAFNKSNLFIQRINFKGNCVPDEVLDNDIDEKELKTYVPNNFTCSDGPNNKAGCLCLTQNDLNYLTNKAGNLTQ